MKRLTHHSRAGFTLVELLVAAALTVLIMAIMATAFQQGMSTLSHLKSVVGLSEQLRSAETIIRNDLEAVHLEAEDGTPVRVSDPRLGGAIWNSPGKGYFQVLQNSVMKQNYTNTLPNYDAAMTSNYTHVQEGTEDGILAVRATDHSIFMAVKRKANSKEDVFYGEAPFIPQLLSQSLVDFASAGAPANQFISEWAEIGLFLVPNGLISVNDDPNAKPLTLYTLVRRQRVLAKNAYKLPLKVGVTPKYWRDNFPETSISTIPNYLVSPPGLSAFVNDPATITDPRNRLLTDWDYTPMIPAQYQVPTKLDVMFPNRSILPTTMPQDKVGTDILLTNVISMQVRMMFNDYTSSTAALTFTGAKFFEELPAVCTTVSPITNTTTFPRSHDTGSAFSTVPNGMNPPIAVPKPVARAIQIRLRIYDTKNHMTRQMTITCDL
jgi:Tfp pilus assembly protein FimT